MSASVRSLSAERVALVQDVGRERQVAAVGEQQAPAGGAGGRRQRLAAVGPVADRPRGDAVAGRGERRHAGDRGRRLVAAAGLLGGGERVVQGDRAVGLVGVGLARGRQADLADREAAVGAVGLGRRDDVELAGVVAGERGLAVEAVLRRSASRRRWPRACPSASSSSSSSLLLSAASSPSCAKAEAARGRDRARSRPRAGCTVLSLGRGDRRGRERDGDRRPAGGAAVSPVLGPSTTAPAPVGAAPAISAPRVMRRTERETMRRRRVAPPRHGGARSLAG